MSTFEERLRSTSSPRTALAYARSAAAFETFRAGRAPTVDVVEQWADSLNHGRLKPQTVAVKMAAVRRWLGFLRRHGDEVAGDTLDVLRDYCITRGARQADRKAIEPATAGEYAEGRDRASAWGRALMGLLWWTGCRISEVVGDPVAGIPFLTVADGRALVQEGHVRTLGKGGRVRILVLPTAARADLAEWCAGRAPDEPLFPSPANPARAITPQATNAMLHKAGLRGAHGFRHAFAGRLRAAGVREEMVASLLGHGPRTTTAGYGKVSIGEMLEAVKQLEEGEDR